MFANDDDIVTANQQESVIIELHTIDVELHSGVELQLEAEVHSDTKINLHERNVELPDREVHNDSEIELNERSNANKRIIEPRLSNYVRRHHPIKQIIGDKEDRPMARNRL